MPTEPVIRQVFIAISDGDQTLERELFVIRRLIELLRADMAAAKDFFYIPSMSCYTVLGRLVAVQPIGPFYHDLRDPDTVSAMALVHQRFLTNTFPIVFVVCSA